MSYAAYSEKMLGSSKGPTPAPDRSDQPSSAAQRAASAAVQTQGQGQGQTAARAWAQGAQAADRSQVLTPPGLLAGSQDLLLTVGQHASKTDDLEKELRAERATNSKRHKTVMAALAKLPAGS